MDVNTVEVSAMDKRTKIIWIVVAAWTVLVAASFTWDYMSAKKEEEELAFRTAKSFFNLVVMTREWNARHGAVYVPVRGGTRPNPFLDEELRDIRVNRDLLLTRINPATMTRQISEIAAGEKINIHITGLDPLNPSNAPTPREVKALNEFNNGLGERGEFIGRGVDRSFFYIAPLEFEAECFQCHDADKASVGDIAGGISVTVPFRSTVPLASLLTGHLLLGILGIIGVLIAKRSLDKAYNTLKKQAILDELTGVPNRRKFAEQIDKEVRRCRRDRVPITVIMCDVDHFKSYNDTYGHARGDSCLKNVATAVSGAVNRPGDFCARYGGEEFVVVLPNTDRKGAMRAAEKIRAAVEELNMPHPNSQAAKVVTISLGVTTSPEAGIDVDQLVRLADSGLYQAKKRGRNQAAYIHGSRQGPRLNYTAQENICTLFP